MYPSKISEAEFIRLFESLGAAETARTLGINERAVYLRRKGIEERTGRSLVPPRNRIGPQTTRIASDHAARIHLKVHDGVVLVGSDAHIWPGPPSTAMRAFLKFAKDMAPDVIILNGDVVDLPQVSRHPPIGWERHPTVADEIEAAQKQLHKLELAARKSCKLIWTLGNHDARFETRLATVAPEYAKIHGVHLKDHFPAWSCCWSAWINDGDVVVKHRYKGGVHATRNNTLNAGRSIVTGHLHSAKVTPLTDYGGTRYGVDTGCLANPSHPAFIDYTEDSPKDWRSGFAVLTFHKGALLFPELATMFDDNHVQFRGTLVKV